MMVKNALKTQESNNPMNETGKLEDRLFKVDGEGTQIKRTVSEADN